MNVVIVAKAVKYERKLFITFSHDLLTQNEKVQKIEVVEY